MPDNILPTIFRSYDIRGIVEQELSEETVRLIGQAIGTVAQRQGEKTIVCARDGRLSGPALMQALQAGITASGCNVIDIGAAPTPVLYYATYALQMPSGVMLTGSHNPANYNGIKMVIAGKALAGDDIQALYQLIVNDNLLQGEGKVTTQQNILQDYVARIAGDIQLAKPLKIVIDCGNGIAGCVAEALYQAIGCEVVSLFSDVDGSFPNHHPDPSQEKNLQDIIAAVKREQADVGLAFDGDADRLGVITPSGEIVWPDRQLILFAQDVLRCNPGAEVIYDVKCSRSVAAMIAAAGGIATMCATGHSWVKAKMRETGAALGGEYSGHLFFKERWYGFDDGLYAGARLCEILAKTDKSLDQLNATIPVAKSTPEIKIPCADDEKFAFIEKFKQQASFPGGSVNTLDGVRVDYAKGFGLVRCSNTTPYLVCRFEADDESTLQQIQDEFYRQMQAVNPSLSL